MKVPFVEIANRVTGFSTPLFGMSWNPPILEVDVARRLVTFLEDRRVLYSPYELELPSRVVDSVLQIRQRLTRDLETVNRASALSESMTAMSAACRKFLDQIRNVDVSRPIHHGLSMLDEMIFLSAIGELRGVFGVHIARIAVTYGIDIEEELAAILPSQP